MDWEKEMVEDLALNHERMTQGERRSIVRAISEEGRLVRERKAREKREKSLRRTHETNGKGNSPTEAESET